MKRDQTSEEKRNRDLPKTEPQKEGSKAKPPDIDEEVEAAFANLEEPEPEKSKKRWLLYLLLLLLLFTSLGFIFNKQIKNFLVGQQSNAIAITDITPTMIEEAYAQEHSYDWDSVRMANYQDILKAQFDNTPKYAIGMVAVPSLKIKLPIFVGIRYDTMLAGAVTLREDQKMGERNYPLISHNMETPGTLFTDLSQIQTGDLIYLTDMTYIYQYHTISLESVEPTRVDLIADVPNETLVTLFTCDQHGYRRWVARGQFDKKVRYQEADKQMADAFGMPENLYLK